MFAKFFQPINVANIFSLFFGKYETFFITMRNKFPNYCVKFFTLLFN